MAVLPRVSGAFSASFKHPRNLDVLVLSCCWGPIARAMLFVAVPLRMDPVAG